MTHEQEQQIKKLMEGTFCPSNFRCYKLGFCDLKTRVRINELLDSLECIKNAHALCIFQTSYGSGYYCTCPVAVYAVKNRLWT